VSTTAVQHRFRVIGMDCADDAREIEAAVREVPSVADARVSVASQILTLRLASDGTGMPAVEQAVNALGYQLDPLGATGDAVEAGTHTHLTSAYRRALWVVVLLNVGYGVVELGGGFLSGSQALKADALDFLGDGLITFLGLIAIGWGLAWRARAALTQGIFLGVLGLGVLISTITRLSGGYQPEAELMGVFGLVALLVNIAATVVLIPHRTGDANVRAVWLFSRNDAIGNLAVVIAAGLVAWSDTEWPDVVVAFAIAGLFLHSAWAIIADARRDLRDATS
jgi:Co/Zn/Cd efflux system component/copper chaperone CopZ